MEEGEGERGGDGNKNRNRKLAAGVIMYNDVKGVSRLLESIYQGLDLIIVVDGKFPQYPGSSDLSCDGSRETVLSFDNTLLVDCPASEYQKRSMYLSICEQEKVDYLLILDTDEYAESGADWQAFRHNMVEMVEVKHGGIYNVFSVLMEVNSADYIKTVHDKPYSVWLKDNVTSIEYGYFPRLWYRPEEMMYYQGTHYKFKNKDLKKRLHFQDSTAAMDIVEGVKFLHRNVYRNAEQMNARRSYQLDFLVPYEAKITSEWFKHYSWPGINAYVDEQPLD
jgi:hypothetical protein